MERRTGPTAAYSDPSGPSRRHSGTARAARGPEQGCRNKELKMTDAEINAGFDAVIAAVQERLPRNLRIRRNLPGDGRLRIDRQLPFLCVHRAPNNASDA